MQYLLMIYGNEAAEAAFAKSAPAQREAMSREFMEFTAAIQKSDNHRGGERLQNTDTATTVRMKDGKVVTTDGPFAETKEQLGGYYVIEARDLDEAIKIAHRVPSVKFGGSVEIRPIWAMPRST